MASLPPPCVIVIFGARGDLTKRLLMPALYNLASSKLLDGHVRILGVDHGDMNKTTWTASLTAMMHTFAKEKGAEFHPDGLDEERWGWVSERCDYLRGDFAADSTYSDLRDKLSAIAPEVTSSNVIFYIATAPRFFGRVVEGLGTAGLLKEEDGAFRRVVIEKPFGSDEPSAQELNACILKQANEEQFFRIDHFLGKEPVRGIFSWRFANRVFDPIWNSENIDHVQITAAETLGVENRGPFYEATGALRDMVPSHLFSVLSMVAMEPPASLDAKDVRDAHAAVLNAIQPISPSDAVRGQYEAGTVKGKEIVAYRDSERVNPETRVETYAALRIHLDAPRWKGVPFYMRTGKALSARMTSVSVVFKAGAPLSFSDDGSFQNVVHFHLGGRGAITIQMLAKKPGPEEIVAPVSSEFTYRSAFPNNRSTIGYESLIYDCMLGRPALFLREDAIDSGWRALQPVLDAWREGTPQSYAAGSPGPTDSDALLAASGRKWLPLS